MPCFKGLAVSIHSDGPLPEYSIQKQSRLSRITSYIPVPPAKINSDSGKPEQSSFSISITLLTPGLSVPYSTPKPTPDNPYPRPQIVGGLPGSSSERGKYTSSVSPYESLTSSANETIAAYIYFDGRQKEEVATLLRRGEETWVNSRWVSVPESEGGGLAEREFLFREVGLERWLNGLDLTGTDVAAKVERRRQRMEKKRRRKKPTPDSSGDEWRTKRKEKSILRYGADDQAPLEQLSDDDSSGSDSDDPIPEATGQIKVALFRVLASGEIKKGEYSPQFDAHDDDDDSQAEGNGSGDIDHTTSFAKPKTLDPKSISTQTVTGIDSPDKPYAVFTFLYRGEKQLQKMGILKSRKAAQATPDPNKRKSLQTDFSKLKPLRPEGTIGFTGIREKDGKSGRRGDDDSDDDDEMKTDEKLPISEGDDAKNGLLSPEDVKKQGELAEGVQKIRLKRQHSNDGLSALSTTRSSVDGGSPTKAESPPLLTNAAYDPASDVKAEDSAIIGSPLKKQRASVSGLDNLGRSSADAIAKGLGFGFVGDTGQGAEKGFGGELPKAAAANSSSRLNSISESASPTKSPAGAGGPGKDEEL